MDFFNRAKQKDQLTRHLNSIFQMYMYPLANDHISAERIRLLLESKKGYEFVYFQFFNTNEFLSAGQKDFLKYIQTKLSIDDLTFKEVIGMKEFTPVFKMPQDYNDRDSRYFLCHLITASLISGFNAEHKKIVVDFCKSIRLTNLLEINYLIERIHSYLSDNQSFDDYDKQLSQTFYELVNI